MRLTEAQKGRKERLVKHLKGKRGIENPYALATWVAQHPRKGGFYAGKKAGNL